MATHASVLAWRIPGTGEPGGLLSMGSHRLRHNWSDLAAAATVFIIGKNQIRGVTFNGWSKKLPTQGSQKHPSNLERRRDCRWGLGAREALVTCFSSEREQSNLPKIFAKQITLQSRARRSVSCLPGQMSLFYPSAPGNHSDMVSCVSHLSTLLHWLEVKS